MKGGIEDGTYDEDSLVQYVYKNLNGYYMFFILPKSKDKNAWNSAITSLNKDKLIKMRSDSDTK